MNLPRSIVIGLLLLASPVLAQDAETATSPNKSHFAAVRSIPEFEYIWRRDLDGFRLVVFRLETGGDMGGIHFWKNVERRYVKKLQWSPDSKFLVLSTMSSGGHSPWRFETFVFSVPDKSLRDADDLIGPVSSPDFHFESPNTVVLRVQVYAHDDGTPENKTVKVNLDRDFRKMPKLK